MVVLPSMMLSTLRARSASSAMITGDLPPNSNVTGVKFFAAACATNLPTAVEPVNSR
ncbi:Uncharacterised protein [Vibrio cholerae]|nr:Uncharacterised protein [Vibrio cholerae]